VTPPPDASGFPDPSSLRWTLVLEGLIRPVDLQHAGDGRLFIVEQAGTVRVSIDGVLQQQPVLDIRQRVGSDGSEQGLLGLAFHPRFASNGFFYINYTDRDGDTVIARYRMDPASDQADSASELILLRIPQPYANHNGGGLAFGPDGYLYIATGDGGSGGDPLNSGQRLDTLLGKLLRVDVDSGVPYAIPEENPFNNGEGLPEIWAYGLRNPWRFTFDRSSGELYIGDVGQNLWEEVDFLPAGSPGGANFGWNPREGSQDYAGSEGLQLIDPVAEYDHDAGCSVTGGVVIRDPVMLDWQGIYLYGDFCSGTIWGLLRDGLGNWQSMQLFSTDLRISSFGEDSSGGVYVVDLLGSIYQLERTP
jgi:glucose/arabinose dehydrogenase